MSFCGNFKGTYDYIIIIHFIISRFDGSLNNHGVISITPSGRMSFASWHSVTNVQKHFLWCWAETITAPCSFHCTVWYSVRSPWNTCGSCTFESCSFTLVVACSVTTILESRVILATVSWSLCHEHICLSPCYCMKKNTYQQNNYCLWKWSQQSFVPKTD